jgi:hypothetical protein
VPSGQLKDPGEQLEKVLRFRKRIEAGKKYLFKSFTDVDEFREKLEAQLAEWLKEHCGMINPALGEVSPSAKISFLHQMPLLSKSRDSITG